MSKWKWDESLTDFLPGANFKDRTGIVYSQLTCLYPTGRKPKHTYWMCICSCGNFIEVSSNNLHTYTTTSCGCRRIGETNPRWSGYKEIPGSYLKNLKSSAETRNIKVEITIEDLWNKLVGQDFKCALSGLTIGFKGKRGSENTASLDRIDSNKDYVLSNVQWLHKNINKMKWDLDQDLFIQYCKLIANNK